MLKANINYIKFIKNNNTDNLLNNCNFTLNKNNIYTIVGKNGSGKSTLLLALIRILNNKDFDIKANVELNSTNIYSLNEIELQKFRAKNFRYIYQDPLSAFDPLKKIEYYFKLLKLPEETIKEELKYFQLPDFSKIKNLYPYELSVGMLQRVNIVFALAAQPEILLMDEPTSALDLPIINLLSNKLKEYATSNNRIILLVTQDLPFAKKVSDFISELKNAQLSDFMPINNLHKMNYK